MQQEKQVIEKIIKRNYLLVILCGLGGTALLMFLYRIVPFTDHSAEHAVYIAVLTILVAVWLSVWIVLIQTTISFERQTREIESGRAESHKLSQENLQKSIQRLEYQIHNLDEYCRQVLISIRVHDLFVNDMGMDDWQALLDEKTWTLDISRKIQNQMIRANIWTIRQLVSLSVDSLVERTGIGELSLIKLRESLHSKCKYLHLELLYIDPNGPDYRVAVEPRLEIYDDVKIEEEEN